MNKIKTFCGICSSQCPVIVSIDNDGRISISGDKDGHRNGFLCPKGRAIPDIVSSPLRLTSPLRKNMSGDFEEISWSEAIDEVSKKLLQNRKEYGAKSLSVHVGESGVRAQFPLFYKRFCESYGTPNYSTADSQCHFSKTMAHKLVHGHGYPNGDCKNSDAIVLWGCNPAMSSPGSMIDINESIRNGGKLVVIDPFKTSLAESADLFLQIRPGSDGALALGILNILISSGKYDSGFVEKYTVGFKELSEYVKEFTLEKVELLTWTSSEDILKLADIYSDSNAVSTLIGIALELQTNGVQSIRAVASIEAITGNLDRIGASRFIESTPLAPLSLDNDVDGEPVGSDKFPLFCELSGEAQANLLPDAILDGMPYPVKSMIVVGSNPILTWPDSNKVKRALENLDFLVVFDNFMTETARYADIILPSAGFLGRYDITEVVIDGETRLYSSPKVMEGDGLSELEFLLKLSETMEMSKDFPWSSEVEALDYRLSPLALDFKTLSSLDSGIACISYTEKKYLNSGFPTVSGKVELFSEKLSRLGYDGLPTYSEPAESMMTNEPNSPYIFTATSGKRSLNYYHSRFRNIDSLNDDSMVVYAHPSVFKKYHMGGDRTVDIYTARGSITAKLVMSDKLCPNTVSIPHGWDDANANELVDGSTLDPISGFPGARSFLVGIDGPEDDH